MENSRLLMCPSMKNSKLVLTRWIARPARAARTVLLIWQFLQISRDPQPSGVSSAWVHRSRSPQRRLTMAVSGRPKVCWAAPLTDITVN